MTGAVEPGRQTDGDHGDPTAAQAFGALATRLNEALARARAALEPHTALLPHGALGELDGFLAEFARRRVRIALYGEVKAGKSTLLNAIAGEALSPVAFEPLTSIPVRVTHGESTLWRVGDQQLASIADVEAVMHNGAENAHEVLVETDLDLLELGGQVDLLDTPGVGSTQGFDAVSAEALRSLDAVVLVVRYPALFTQFTRRLMDSLEADISKLFVVWNLDADCAELSADERARHAETLRANIAGAHDLFLVDARAGFRAMQRDDGAGSVASGLTSLIAALRQFASSRARQVAALREAAKRGHHLLDSAQQRFAQRREELAQALAEARGRIERVQAAAETERATVRSQIAKLEAAVAQIGAQATASTNKLAQDFRRQLRRARRRWIARGDIGALHAAVANAAGRYAAAVHATNRDTLSRLRTEAARFGTMAPDNLRPHPKFTASPLAPEERSTLATAGRCRLWRRALWRRWYLPGLTMLEHVAIGDDQNAQAAWLAAARQGTRDAAAATLRAKLEAIAQRADAATTAIKTETDFAANAAEFEQLGDHTPVVTAQVEAVTRIGAEARALVA
jgi:predicted GTPase